MTKDELIIINDGHKLTFRFEEGIAIENLSSEKGFVMELTQYDLIRLFDYMSESFKKDLFPKK